MPAETVTHPDSPYARELDGWPNPFAGRPDVYDVDAASAREVRFRLNAACRALRELDADGAFGTGSDRPLLWLEGGDVDDGWLNKWAKKLNPPAAFARFKARGDQRPEPIGTFTEFGTKKVYETSRYAASGAATRLVAASNYHLFLFDTTGGMKQLASKQFPNRSDAQQIWDVATSNDALLTAVTAFGSGSESRVVRLVSGPKWADVVAVRPSCGPTSVAVDPAGQWVAIGCGDGSAAIYDPTGSLLRPLSGRGEEGHIHSDMAVSGDGSRLAWADGRGTVRVWDTAGWTEQAAIIDHADVIDFDPSGRQVVLTTRWTRPLDSVQQARGRQARVFDVETGELVHAVEVPGFLIHRAVFSPDGRLLACALKGYTQKYNIGQEVALVTTEGGRVVDQLRADFESVYDFVFLPHRGEIAVAVYGHTRRPLVLWKPNGLLA